MRSLSAVRDDLRFAVGVDVRDGAEVVPRSIPTALRGDCGMSDSAHGCGGKFHEFRKACRILCQIVRLHSFLRHRERAIRKPSFHFLITLPRPAPPGPSRRSPASRCARSSVILRAPRPSPPPRPAASVCRVCRCSPAASHHLQPRQHFHDEFAVVLDVVSIVFELLEPQAAAPSLGCVVTRSTRPASAGRSTQVIVERNEIAHDRFVDRHRGESHPCSPSAPRAAHRTSAGSCHFFEPSSLLQSLDQIRQTGIGSAAPIASFVELVRRRTVFSPSRPASPPRGQEPADASICGRLN